MTRASLFVSLNTINIGGFEQVLLPLGSRTGDSVYTMQDAFPSLPGASVRNPTRDKVMRKEANIRKACSDFRDPSGNS